MRTAFGSIASVMFFSFHLSFLMRFYDEFFLRSEMHVNEF